MKIKGDTIARKVQYCMSFDECANTNLYAVFRQMMEMDITPFSMMEKIPGSEQYAPVSA